MKTMADAIFIAGRKIMDDDIVSAILMDLPSEYDMIVAMVRNRLQNSGEQSTNLTVQEVLAMCLSRSINKMLKAKLMFKAAFFVRPETVWIPRGMLIPVLRIKSQLTW